MVSVWNRCHFNGKEVVGPLKVRVNCYEIEIKVTRLRGQTALTAESFG